MIVLGISGLEASVPFKRIHWPGLEEREYRISQGHDSAAALVIDGTLAAAAAEERFNRRKHTGDFPAGAIGYCLAEAGLSTDDVDEIAQAFDYSPYVSAYSADRTTSKLYHEVFSRNALLRQIDRDLPGFPPERVYHVDHHLAHAASAYFTSGWDECLVVVVDAMGEVHSLTAYHARGGKLDRLRHISARDSVGILYSLVTLHLGFDFNSDEYKIMGLAPYGNRERFRPFFDREVIRCEGGTIKIPMLWLNRTREQRENYSATRRYLNENLIEERRPDADITDDHRDVAAGLQECLESTMQHICGYFATRTGLRRLALAGGVALNCTANATLNRSGVFDDIYVQPAAGDDGAALGAALYRASLTGRVRHERLPVPFFGPAYAVEDIEAVLAEHRDRIEVTRFETLEETCQEAARLISEGSVIAWYRGRMEFGPRALGHRSILADPGHPQMRDRINATVKMREAFRPFAPAVSLEQVHIWFDVPPMTELPYMTMTVEVRERWRAELPAITHINGSARVQTVAASGDQDFHTLLRMVGKATGREMVLNTSFNVKGQPIVNTPKEALQTFLATDIGGLFIENNLIRSKMC